MDDRRRVPSWLKATIRATVVAAAVGGGLFVLSQALAPSQASADTVTAPAQQHPARSAAAHGTADSAAHHRETHPVAATIRRTSAAADRTVAATTHASASVVRGTSNASSSLVGHTVSALPTPLRAPVARLTTPAVGAVQQVTAPVVSTLNTVGGSHPVSRTVGTVARTASAVVQPLVDAATTDPASGTLPPATGGILPARGTVGPPSVAAPASTSTRTAASAGATSLSPLASAARAWFEGGFAESTPSSVPAAAAITAVGSGVAGNDSGTPGLPATPLPGSPAALAGACSSADGGSGGNGSPSAPALAPTIDIFTPLAAGSSSLDASDALPASPVYEHDSTPD